MTIGASTWRVERAHWRRADSHAEGRREPGRGRAGWSPVALLVQCARMRRELPQQPVELPAFLHVERSGGGETRGRAEGRRIG